MDAEGTKGVVLIFNVSFAETGHPTPLADCGAAEAHNVRHSLMSVWRGCVLAGNGLVPEALHGMKDVTSRHVLAWDMRVVELLACILKGDVQLLCPSGRGIEHRVHHDRLNYRA